MLCDQLPDGDRSELSHRPTMFKPYISVGLLSCAAVSTAQYLGMGWVSDMVLGVPAGLWIAGALTTATWWRERAGRGATTASLPGAAGRAASLAHGVQSSVRTALAERAGSVARRFMAHPIYARPESQNEVTELGPELIKPERPTARKTRDSVAQRIAVSGPAEFVDAFVEQAREEVEAEASFEPVATPIRESAECVKRALAGAVTFTEAGQTSIVLPEHRGRDAAWSDWSQRLALSYPAVFPPRVDPARIVCGPVRIHSARESRLIARLADASSTLSQIEARTGYRRSNEWRAVQQQNAARSMTALARTFVGDWGTTAPAAASPVCRTAARAVSAWLSMCDTGIEPQERRAWIQTCSTFLADEPESYLRLAAAHIGAFEDDESLPSLKRAFELMRASGEVPLSDPLAFVLAEMEVGAFNSMSLGRVAAGLAIAWATTPAESLDYLRDDLIDDLQFSGRLMGREQDRAFLKHVMEHMDQLRSGGKSMPVKAAA